MERAQRKICPARHRDHGGIGIGAPDKIDLYAQKPAVACGCGSEIFDGEMLRVRILRVLPAGVEAKCRSCKAWVRVPLAYQPL